MATYLVPDKIKTLFNLTVKEHFLTSHNPNKISLPAKRSKSLIGVTVHNTGWINVAAATTPAEQYTRATVNGNMNTVRVHFYVDDKCAWQNLPLDYQSWHAGQSGKADKNGSEAGNQQTISIECIMGGTTGEQNLKARDNCAKLVAYLLYSNNLTINQLYTHNYWCNVRNGYKGTVDELNLKNDNYKNCPIYIRPKWCEFKSLVQYYMDKYGKGLTTEQPTTQQNTENKTLPYRIKILDKTMNIRKDAGTNNPVTCVVKQGGVYTIIEEKMVGNVKWGKLKSGAGWISLNEKYVKKL